MSRLTKKEKNRLSCHQFKECDYLRNGTPRIKTLTKLGKLEDLEDELGCPLEVVFKALKEGIYCQKLEDDKKLFDYYVYGIDDCDLLIYLSYHRYNDCDDDETKISLKDYGKTWWLKSEMERL